MADREVIRIGLLGAGRHSQATHGPALRELVNRREAQPVSPGKLPRLELAAVCDLDYQKAQVYADEFGFRTIYTSLSEMVETESLDALFLITPLVLTEKITTEALPFGLPLLIEKPPGANLEETRRLVAAAKQNRTPHMISFNRRFNPALRHAMAWIAEAPDERRPHTVVARMLRHNRREADFAVGTGIHLIDAVISMMGAPRNVASLNSPLDSDCRFFNAGLDFGEGASANILIAPSCGRHEETIEAHGADFSFDIDIFANRFRLFREKEIVATWDLPESEDPRLADVIAETEHFLASLDEPNIRPNLEDGLISMETATSIQEGTARR